MRMDESTLLFILLALVQLVRTDFEHTCDISVPTPQRNICPVALMNFIFSRCIPERPDLSQTAGVQSGLFISADEASQLLTNPFGNARRGLPCECCVQRCTLREFDQYCAPLRRHVGRRLRRRAPQQSSRYFTETEVNEVYETISKLNESEDTNKMPLQQLHKLFQIKEWKEKNIVTSELAKLSSLEATKKSKPPTNGSPEWRTPRPNKESKYHTHRHSHRNGQRGVVNSQN